MKIYKTHLYNQPMIRTLLVMLAVGTMLVACGKKNKQAVSKVHIPKTASIAAVIDLKQISEKAPNWRDVFKADFLQKLDVDIDSKQVAGLQQLVERVISSIDQDEKLSVFNGQVSKDRNKNHFALTFVIADVAAFEKALTTDKGITIVKNKDSKHVFLDNKTILSWKEGSGLLVGYEFKAANRNKELVSKVAELRKTTAADALDNNNQKFKALLGENHDIAIWANQQETRNFSPSVEMYSKLSPTIANLINATKYGTSYIDFLEGKIVMNGKTMFDGKATEKYQTVLGISNENVIKSLPIKDPLLLMSLSISMKDIRKIMEEENAYDKFDAEALKTLQELDLTVKDVAEMLSGDLVAAVEDLELNNLQKASAKLVLGIGLNNRKVLEKLLSKYTEMGLLQKQDNIYRPVIPLLGFDPQIIVTDDAVFLTATEEFKEAITSAKATNLNEEMLKKTKESNFMLFLRPSEILRKIPKENFSDELLEELLPKIESVIVNTLPAKKEVLEGNVTVYFKDKKTNALQQLLSLKPQKVNN
ncbi:hypothetical protein [Microscilla marina]|nr:hypothetical protein [Microscilla marina]